MTRYDFPDEHDALMTSLLSLADQLTVHTCLVITLLLNYLSYYHAAIFPSHATQSIYSISLCFFMMSTI